MIKIFKKMNEDKITECEEELLSLCFEQLKQIPNLYILGYNNEKRIGCVSFGVENIHYNLRVRLLNDRFGIQTRGGCSCAGTYGHFLLNVDQLTSKAIEQKILDGCLMERPGWVRMSIHPTMTNAEVDYICEAIKKVAKNLKKWHEDYKHNIIKNEFEHIDNLIVEKEITKNWYNL